MNVYKYLISLHPYKEDIIGVASSLLCLVHCVAFPLFFLYGIQIGTDWEQQIEFVALLFLLISFIAVFYSTKNSNSFFIKLFLCLFFTSLGIGVLFEEDFEASKYFLQIGSVGLVFTHIFNIRHCALCKKCTPTSIKKK